MSYKQGKTALALTRAWHRTSANDRVLGGLSARIAWVLMGKHKPTYHPTVDAGDYVVVEHAANVQLTGKKSEDKKYFFHSGYPGGEKWIPITRLKERHPEDIIRRAVSGMLPKNYFRKRRLARLLIYPGEAPAHVRQNAISTWRDEEVETLRKSVRADDASYTPPEDVLKRLSLAEAKRASPAEAN